MAKLTVKVNNVVKYAGDSEKAKQARYAMNTLVCTLNPTPGVAEKASLLANKLESFAPESALQLGEAYKTTLEASGSPDDVISIEIDDKEAGSITRKQLAYKIYLALHPELWMSKLTKVTKESKVNQDSGDFELEI